MDDLEKLATLGTQHEAKKTTNKTKQNKTNKTKQNKNKNKAKNKQANKMNKKTQTIYLVIIYRA